MFSTSLKGIMRSHFCHASARASHAYRENRTPFSYFQMECFHGYIGNFRCAMGDDRHRQSTRCISKPDRESFPFRRRDAPRSPTLFLGKRWECATSLQFLWQKCFGPTLQQEHHWALTKEENTRKRSQERQQERIEERREQREGWRKNIRGWAEKRRKKQKRKDSSRNGQEAKKN